MRKSHEMFFQIFFARSGVVMHSNPVSSILPPSIGPKGTKLNKPIPKFKTYNQYNKPRIQRIDSVVNEPYFAMNASFF